MYLLTHSGYLRGTMSQLATPTFTACMWKNEHMFVFCSYPGSLSFCSRGDHGYDNDHSNMQVCVYVFICVLMFLYYSKQPSHVSSTLSDLLIVMPAALPMQEAPICLHHKLQIFDHHIPT